MRVVESDSSPSIKSSARIRSIMISPRSMSFGSSLFKKPSGWGVLQDCGDGGGQGSGSGIHGGVTGSGTMGTGAGLSCTTLH